MSNGLSDPIGLWLGHLLFDSIFSVILATLIIVIFAGASNQFHGLGLFVSHFAATSEGCDNLLSPVGRFGSLRNNIGSVFVLRISGDQLALGFFRGCGRLSDHHVHREHFLASLMR